MKKKRHYLGTESYLIATDDSVDKEEITVYSNKFTESICSTKINFQNPSSKLFSLLNLHSPRVYSPKINIPHVWKIAKVTQTISKFKKFESYQIGGLSRVQGY